jgi:nitrogen fixation protein FixH
VHLWRAAFFIAIIACLAACAPPSAGPTPEEKIVDGMTISLEANTAPQLNMNEVFIVTLRDAAGQLIDSADVYLDLDMPAMPMGANQPIAEPLQNGQYRAETAYTMTGDWTVDVIVIHNGKEYRARFERAVAEE